VSSGVLAIAWQFHESYLVPNDASPGYRCGAHIAFYSGALVAIEFIKISMGLPYEDALANLQQLEHEARSFGGEHCHPESNGQTAAPLYPGKP
jgi:hypothetical protein